ncbi:MAG: DNA polymerase III subunit delta [Flavobacteriales bacterium]|nr:DNA polymerase III subunit delta [Flavobacteriales bacterium]|tara:strand:+ start:47052 stop:48053 length:1002 start_codon:yes stop_codon:yes gene_type:complete
MNYKDILADITDKKTSPIYFLVGEEPYYIDKLCNEFSNKLIKKEERDFNQVVFYGKDTNIEEIILECKQFPFGAEKRLVIIKEAQSLKNIELLDSYFDNPQLTTVLVIAYKKKSIDKRKKFGKNLNKKTIVFESSKIYDNQIPTWILNYLNKKEFKIENNAIAILTEHIGANLSKIANELEKLMLVVPKNKKISNQDIELHIGISKDFNIFELQNEIGKRNIYKTNQIIQFFSKNTKNYHIVSIIGSLFSFFQKLLTYHFTENKSKSNIASVLQINPYFINQYEKGANNYSKKQIFKIIEYLKEYDLKSKGVMNKSFTQNHLLQELIFKILHA